MITLDELKKLSGDKETKFNERLKNATKPDIEKYEKVFDNAIYNLSNRLKSAAIDGATEFTVIKLSAYGNGLNQIVTDEIKIKMRSSGNFYCAWRDKKITEKDVIENMVGNLKRVYNYLKEKNLDPHIDYWTDGGGMDEGFCVVVRW